MKLLILLLLVSCAGIQKTIPIKPEFDAESFELFKSRSNLPWVHELQEAANCVIKKESFAHSVREVTGFTYSDKSGVVVYEDLTDSRTCTISTYKTKWYSPFKYVVMATTWPSDKEKLYLNLRVNPRPMPDMIETVIHECLHLKGYSHGDNSRIGKENSVNYKVGALAKKNSDGCY